MSLPVKIVMIEDDEGHARLIERNIRRSGVNNEILPFTNGTDAVKYLFGKVTMYPHFNQKARNMILYFLKKHFKDPDGLVIPIDPANIDLNTEEMKKIFRAWGWRRQPVERRDQMLR